MSNPSLQGVTLSLAAFLTSAAVAAGAEAVPEKITSIRLPGKPREHWVWVNDVSFERIEAGRAAPFDFDPRFRPAPGVQRNLSGTPPILSLAALDAGLQIFKRADMDRVREKSMRLGDAFIELTAPLRDEFGFALISPADASLRGSQVALTHPEGFAIVQALIARGVVGDFRALDILRFGFSPLYNRYVDIWDAVRHLEQIMVTVEWERHEFRERQAVT